MSEAEQYGLARVCKEVIVNQVIGDADHWRVLVVDNESVKVISAAAKMYDVMDKNITVVENISLKRQPIPQMEAIYFLTPSREIVEALCEDFQGTPLYACAHVFFTSNLERDLLELMAKSKITKYIKELKVINFNFKVFESRLFTADIANPLPKRDDLNNSAAIHSIAENLASVCAICGYFPYILCPNDKDDSLSVRIATELNQMLCDMKSDKELKRDPDCQIMILDRSFDPITPLLTDFTFQAMINDLLEVEDFERINIALDDGGSPEEHYFSDTDSFWQTLRHKHIPDVTQIIVDKFQDFASSNQACQMKLKGHSINTRQDLSATIRSIPEFKELVTKISFYNALTENCMKLYNSRKLKDIAEIEQSMATGLDENGDKPTDIMSQLRNIMDDETIRKEDKLKVLMLYIITKGGVKEKELKQICDEFSLSTEERLTVHNLLYIGVTVTSIGKGKSKSKSKEKKKKTEDDDVPYVLSRYVPPLRKIIEDMVAHNIDSSKFKFIGREPKATSSKKHTKEKKNLKTTSTKTKEANANISTVPTLVFIAGGMSFAEARTVYQVSEKQGKNVYGGTTNFITPDSFCDDLLSLNPEEEEDEKVSKPASKSKK